MTDVIRSVTVKVRGDISDLDRKYRAAGKSTDDFADKLERAGDNSKLLDDRQKELGKTLDGNNSSLTRYGSNLERVSGRTSTAGGETEKLERRTSSLGRSTGQTGNQIDRLSGRLKLLLGGVVALGPGIVAGGVVPLAGLLSQGVATGVGLGVLIGSFQGIGDAVKAMNKYAIDPSITNLKAQQQALQGLSPAAVDMAQNIVQHAIPALKTLRDEGATATFPGLIEGAKELGTRLPQTRLLMREVGDELGDLATRGGKALAGDDWDKVFNYAIAKTPGLLDDTLSSVGNLALAFGNLWSAVDPLTQSFSGGLLDWTEKLAKGSAGLDTNESFQHFLAYAEKEGPVVAHTLGQIVDALIAVGEAGAPISGPLIKALGMVASMVENIADSPIGPPLIAGALAMTAYARATELAGRAQLRLTASSASFLGGGGMLSKGRTSLGGFVGDLRSMGNEYGRTGKLQSTFLSGLSNTTGAAQRTRASLGSLAKGGAVLGALAIASTGAASSMGLTSTASLALAGTMLGPWGTALGAGVGLLLDTNSAGKDVARTFDELNAAAGGDNISQLSAKLKDAKGQMDDIASRNEYNPLSSLKTGMEFLGGLAHGDNIANNYQDTDKAAASLAKLKSTYLGIAEAMGKPLPPNSSPQQIQAFADQIGPALQQAGIDVNKLGTGTYAGIQKAAEAVQEYVQNTDTMAAATATANTLLTSTRLEASALATALDAVFSPKLNRAQANDAFLLSIKKLKSELKGSAGLVGSSDGAISNRGLVNSSAAALNAKLKADADAGASSDQLVRKLAKGRQAILDQGEAAGISRPKMRAYLNTLGLTPDLVETLIKLDGATAAERMIARVQARLAKLNGTQAFVGIHIIRTGADIAGAVGANARGGIYTGGVRRYAGGGMDVRDNHQPEMVSAGAATTRVWAEPETGGEAYIPLRNDSRRPRAKQITALTAQALGGVVQWNALGSFTGTDFVPGYNTAQDAQAIQSSKSQIDDLVRQLGKKGKKALKGNARLDAQRSLDAARAEYEYLTHKAYYDQLADAEANKPDLAQIAADAAAARDASSSAFRSSDLFARGATASGVSSSVQRLTQDISNYGNVLVALKTAKASPALLKLVIDKGQSGDFASAIRLGKSLLANPETLMTLNSQLDYLQNLSDNTAGLVNDASFTGAGAYTGSFTAAPVSIDRSVNIDILGNLSEATASLRQEIAHEVSAQLAQARS